MNITYYIAKKIHQGKSEDKKVSQPIIRFARLSIILAMAINIITLAVVTGFQQEVKDKVIGFGSHATITKAGEISTFESAPIIFNDSLQKVIQNINGVKGIQPFALKKILLYMTPTVLILLSGKSVVLRFLMITQNFCSSKVTHKENRHFALKYPNMYTQREG